MYFSSPTSVSSYQKTNSRCQNNGKGEEPTCVCVYIPYMFLHALKDLDPTWNTRERKRKEETEKRDLKKKNFMQEEGRGNWSLKMSAS